jgi:hypothetical protein
MSIRDPLPVYLPHNEPYLGRTILLAFDKSIPPALEIHMRVAERTFRGELNPLQVAATEIIPQGVSIALSIRELVRQAYLYSAGILIRPLLERVGTIRYLQHKPDAVELWRSGWPRKTQPTLQDLLDLLHPGREPSEYSILRELMNKLVHSDPAGSMYNMLKRADGMPVFSSGKIIDDPNFCDAVCAAGMCYLKQLSSTALAIFPDAA